MKIQLQYIKVISTLSSFRLSSFHPYIVLRVFQGFAFLFHVSSLLQSSPVSIETLYPMFYAFYVYHLPWIWGNMCSLYNTELLFTCSIVSFYGIIYNWTFGTLVLLHFLPPPLYIYSSPPFRSSSFSAEILFYNLLTVGGLTSSKLPPAVSYAV